MGFDARREGIEHGRTGFLCDTVDEMSALVGRLPEIDRAAVRAEAERRFSDAAIISAYEALQQISSGDDYFYNKPDPGQLNTIYTNVAVKILGPRLVE